MKYKFHHSLTRALFFIAALAVTALGCGWMSTTDSVRFNGYKDYKDMGRLPPLPTLAHESNPLAAPSNDKQSPAHNYTFAENHSHAVDGFWESAAAFEKDGKLTEELNRLLEYLERTRIARNLWFDPTDRAPRRNSAIDKVDALAALNQGSPRSRVQAY